MVDEAARPGKRGSEGVGSIYTKNSNPMKKFAPREGIGKSQRPCLFGMIELLPQKTAGCVHPPLPPVHP